MARSSVRGEGSRPRVRQAGELGWDDSLYAEDGDTVQDPAQDVRERPAGTADTADTADAPGGGRKQASGGTPAGPGSPARPGKGGGSGPGGRPPRRRRRALRWSATVLAVLILGTAGAGYLYYQHLNGNIKKDDLNLGDEKDRAAAPTANAAGQTPLNVLLIGSDARDTKENQELGGAKETFGSTPLADVQMLLHLSADRTNMSVISMPRDTLLQIPKCTDPDDGKVYQATTGRTMTNQSLGRGGPGCTVATWEKLTGIHIDHFMQIDFSGVVSMADAIGGVPVCVDANIYSKDSEGHGSGLKLTEGTHSIKGEQALQWLRTRYGFEDGSDLGRARAQHQYMSSMIRQLRENATITNPNKLRRLAETATNALTVDPGLDTVKKLYDLGSQMRDVKPERVTMTTMPNRYVGARVEPTEDAEKLFRLVRDDIALDGKDKKKSSKEKASDDPAAADAEIGVLVQNGTRTDTLAPVAGRASAVSQLLAEDGFARATADTTTATTEDKTVIRYPSADLEGDAQRVAKSLGIEFSSVKKSTDVSGVTLIVGADWREGDTYKAAEEDDTLPDTADALSGDKKKCMHVNSAFTF
ncbi:LCP family protein [Streptomyces sp. NPDC059785]|uniref:LCP family protein n=3 Tax=unclassified Streptomyces TaxID=2593676 RepID=UPI00365976DB